VYDDLQKAEQEKQLILQEMKTAFNDGTDEGKQKAIDLRQKLDEAQVKVDQLNATYQSILNASKPSSSPAADFLPTPGTDEALNDGNQAKSEMTRAAYDALEPAEKMKFVKSGGKISD
jgi:hypothetical protein